MGSLGLTPWWTVDNTPSLSHIVIKDCTRVKSKRHSNCSGKFVQLRKTQTICPHCAGNGKTVDWFTL